MNISTSTPLVSVIIPTYNRAASLGNAIESVINQTYPNIQLIVVDDGSTDETTALIKQYENVEYILQVHGGQGKARNNGLKHARGAYIASLDSDDMWHHSFIEKSVAKLEQGQLDFVFCNWLQVIDDRQGFDFFLQTGILDPYLASEADAWIDLKYEELRALYIDICPSPSSSFVIRRSSIRTKWNEQLNIADDWCLLLEIIFSGKCKAAFTFERLWVKKTDGKNICDGRNYFELIKLLYRKDLDIIISILKNDLTKTELRRIQRTQAGHFYRYTLSSLITWTNVRDGIKMFRQGMSIAPGSFIPLLFSVIRNKFKNTISRFGIQEVKKELIPIPEFRVAGKLNAEQPIQS
jgi:glycosyltransferase involved in cell wall biosynthesis